MVVARLARAFRFDSMWEVLERKDRIRLHRVPASLFSAIIQSYGRANMVDEVLTAFASAERILCKPTVGTYAALISVLVKIGHHAKALIVYQQMLDNGLSPSATVCKTLLQGLALSGDIDAVKRFLAQLMDQGWNLDVSMYNALIRGYIEAGKVDVACMTLATVGVKANAFTYTMLVLGCCKAGQVQKALEIYREMVMTRGFSASGVVLGALVGGLCKLGAPREAYRLLSSTSNADVVSHTLVIDALSKNGDCDLALQLLQVMERNKIAPNVITYSSLINGLCKAGRLEAGIRMFQQMQAAGCAPNSYTYNSLIHGLCEAGRLDDAFSLLRAIKGVPSIANKNTLMNGICKQIVMEHESRELSKYGKRLFLEDMAQSFSAEEDRLGLLYSCLEYMFGNNSSQSPNECTYSIIIHFLCKVNKVVEASKVWSAMKQKISFVDAVAYNSLLYGLVRLKDLNEAARLFGDIEKPTLVSHSLLIDGYLKAGKFSKASELYERMVRQGICPDLVLYNILLNGLSKANLQTDMSQLCAEMLNNGILPTVVTYSILIHRLCTEGHLQAVEDIIQKMKERGCKPNSVTYNTVLHCLCEHGHLEEAIKLFREMRHYCCYTPATWNILIDGVLESWDLREAETIFSQLIRDGCFPRYITYDAFIDRIIQAQNCPDSRYQTALSFGYNRIVDFFLDA